MKLGFCPDLISLDDPGLSSGDGSYGFGWTTQRNHKFSVCAVYIFFIDVFSVS